MDTLICKDCRRTSSVTSSSQKIRCHGCQKIIEAGRAEPSDSFRTSKCLSFYQRNSRSLSLSPSPRSLPQPPPREKRAFLCGVSYKSQKFKLRGTTQDVIKIRDILTRKFGFPDNSFLILAEDDQNRPPTKNNILEAFKWLTTDLQKDDSLVFYFSGHGIRQLEFNQDELDGFDEAICPVDFETEGMITDNKINEMIVAPLKEGVTLHAIIDACHSGTLLDLPYVYNKSRGNWDPPPLVRKGTSGGKACCISACEDYQLAADTSMFSPDKSMAGAMTHTFIKAVNDSQEITYRQILDSMHNAIDGANKAISRGIRRLFHRQMLQDPILSSSEPFDINTVFKL